MSGVRTLVLEMPVPGSLDDAGLAAALVAAGRHVRRVRAYESALMAELKRRRGEGAKPLVKRDRTRPSKDVKDLDAGASAVEAVPALGDAALPTASLVAVGTAVTARPELVPVLNSERGAALLAAGEDQSAEEFRKGLEVLLASLDAAAGREDPEAQRYFAERGVRFYTSPERGPSLYANGPADSMALIQAAVEAVANERWCAEHPERNETLGVRADNDQRYYDALVEIASRVVNGDAGAALPVVANGSAFNRRTPPPVTIIVQNDGAAQTVDGHPVATSSVERLACNARLFALAMAGEHVVLDMGLAERWATPEQYLALLARDRRCRFPGCRIPGKYTVVHHLVQFPLGPTDIHNMCLLCDRHHHLVHDGNWRMESTPTGKIAVYRPDGSLFETLDTS